MEQNHIDNCDAERRGDLNSRYRGTVRIKLESLVYVSAFVREPQRSIIESLNSAFKKEGCHRLPPQNHVPASITESGLKSARKASRLKLENLMGPVDQLPPLLQIPHEVSVVCLHGRQRLEAAREFLEADQRWWTVDLYLQDTENHDNEWQQLLAEEYSNSTRFSDGEVYVRIRQYAQQSAYFAERRWWARLSKRKGDFLKSFLKHPLRNSFDPLLCIPGLWRGLNIGVMDKLIALKCDEEISHYTNHILRVWKKIFRKNEDQYHLIDPESVWIVQSRAPAASKADKQFVTTAMLNMTLFPNIQSARKRERIQKYINRTYYLIPTIHTLFEDVKYLRASQQALKRLLPMSTSRTVQEAARASFVTQDSQIDTRRFRYNYLQLWLFAMRNFVPLTGELPRKEKKESRLVETVQSPAVWCDYAKLAQHLGFSSEAIENRSRADPDIQMARSALLSARNSREYTYSEAELSKYTKKIARMFKRAAKKPHRHQKPLMFTCSYGERLSRRCGRVHEEAYEKHKDHLTLEQIYNFQKAKDSRQQEYDVSSFFVRQCVVVAFFGSVHTAEFVEPVDRAPTSHSYEAQPKPRDNSRLGDTEAESYLASRSHSVMGDRMSMQDVRSVPIDEVDFDMEDAPLEEQGTSGRRSQGQRAHEQTPATSSVPSPVPASLPVPTPAVEGSAQAQHSSGEELVQEPARKLQIMVQEQPQEPVPELQLVRIQEEPVQSLAQELQLVRRDEILEEPVQLAITAPITPHQLRPVDSHAQEVGKRRRTKEDEYHRHKPKEFDEPRRKGVGTITVIHAGVSHICTEPEAYKLAQDGIQAGLTIRVKSGRHININDFQQVFKMLKAEKESLYIIPQEETIAL